MVGSRALTASDRRLRLAIATPRYLPFTGGVENHVMQVAPRLRRAGVDVTVLTTDPSGRLPERDEIDGVGVRRFRSRPRDADHGFAPGILDAVRTGEWSLVHVQSYHTFVAPLAMAGARLASIPYVVTFHGGGHSSPLRHRARRRQRAFLRPLLARADRLVATARFEIELYSRQLEIPRRRFVLIPNGSDVGGAPAARSDPEPGLIVSIGRLERYKGHQRILAAFPHIVRRRADARLWIAGTGPYEGHLRDMADRLGVAASVEIRGLALERRDEMATELAKAGVVVLLSEFETHPMAALEAAASGSRLVVADTSGLRELSDDGFARAIPLDSRPEDVATAVLEELDAPAQSRRIPSLPTWDDCARSLLALYESVAEGRRCAS